MEFSKIPGMKEAIEAAKTDEEALREFAFSGVEDEICGNPVEPFNLGHLRKLLLIHSPFVCGGEVELADIPAFLWIVTPERDHPRVGIFKRVFRRAIRGITGADYRFEEKANSDESRKKFARQIALVQEDWKTGIYSYLSRSTMDAPSGGSGSTTDAIVGTSAAIIHRLAATYGWTVKEIESIPLAAIYQFIRMIWRDADPKATFVNLLTDVTRNEKFKEWQEANK